MSLKIFSLFLVSAALVGFIESTSPEDLLKHCHQAAVPDSGHFAFFSSECEIFCTPYEDKDNRTINPGLVCSFNLQEWCDPGVCRHFDKQYNASVKTLTYGAIATTVNTTTIRYEACIVSGDFDLALTPLEDRTECVACDFKIDVQTEDGKYTKTDMKCPLDKLLYKTNDALLIEGYAKKLDDSEYEMNIGAEKHNIPDLRKTGENLNHVRQSGAFLTEYKDGRITQQIKNALFIIYS